MVGSNGMVYCMPCASNAPGVLVIDPSHDLAWALPSTGTTHTWAGPNPSPSPSPYLTLIQIRLGFEPRTEANRACFPMAQFPDPNPDL